MTGPRVALGGPQDDLQLAYRGTAYFLRWLAQLPEREYAQRARPTSPHDRRTTIATVGYDARGWAHLAAGIREGRPAPMTFAPGDREAAISRGATLPSRALRHLVEHSAVHLAVEWRDLPADAWSNLGYDHLRRRLRVGTTPWLRARQVWLAAVELGAGAHVSDFPPSLSERLLAEASTDDSDPS